MGTPLSAERKLAIYQMTIFYGLHKSDKPDKKFFVEVESQAGNRIRVYFGDAKSKDYTLYSPLEREEHKRRYIQRHSKTEDWTSSGRESAGFYARWILWNKPTVAASLRDMKARFF